MNKIFDFLILESGIKHKIVYSKIIEYRSCNVEDIGHPISKNMSDKIMYIEKQLLEDEYRYYLNSDVNNSIFVNNFKNDIIVINYKFINHTINLLQKYREKD